MRGEIEARGPVVMRDLMLRYEGDTLIVEPRTDDEYDDTFYVHEEVVDFPTVERIRRWIQGDR